MSPIDYLQNQHTDASSWNKVTSYLRLSLEAKVEAAETDSACVDNPKAIQNHYIDVLRSFLV